MSVTSRVALRELRKNRVRTAVTIIGVILSAAMLTAVTVFISSLLHFYYMTEALAGGEYFVRADACTPADREALAADSRVESFSALETLGFSAEYGYDRDYLAVCRGDAGFYDMMTFTLTSGALPAAGNELLLPVQAEDSFDVGDTLTLTLGDRFFSGAQLDLHTDVFDGETLENTAVSEWTVCGFYSAPRLTTGSTPARVAYTRGEVTGTADVFTVLDKPADSFAFAAELPQNTVINDDLLLALGVSQYTSFTDTLYSLAAILIALILLGSVSLIYNAFAISVSERKRRFGMLCSVGATRRQLRASVFAEAAAVGAIGIPGGLLLGCAGIGVTLRLLGNAFLFSSSGLTMSLYVTPESLLIAALIAAVTVLLSAWVPARRAARTTAIAAIRGSDDVKLTARAVKTPRLVRKLFGMSGDLALKSFRRNKKRFRAAVISLTLSVTLFVSASSFCTYLTRSVSGAFGSFGDVIVAQNFPLNAHADELYSALASHEDVTSVFRQSRISARSTDYGFIADDARWRTGDTPHIDLYALDDASWARVCAECGIAEDAGAIFCGQLSWIDSEQNKFSTLSVLKYVPETVTLYSEGDDIEYNDGSGTVTKHIAPFSVTLGIAAEADEFFWDYGGSHPSMRIITSVSSLAGADPQLIGNEDWWHYYYIETSEHEEVTAAARKLAVNNGFVSDVAANQESERNIILVIKVFSYGFIVLISLIAAANVFNTVSTSLLLRRREFAMLFSVGMTGRDFHRMQRFECLFCGAKALLFGLPAAAAFTYLIWRGIMNGFEMKFYLPWQPVAIAAASVFAVVGAAIIYGSSRIRKANIADTLKSDLQ